MHSGGSVPLQKEFRECGGVFAAQRALHNPSGEEKRNIETLKHQSKYYHRPSYSSNSSFIAKACSQYG